MRSTYKFLLFNKQKRPLYVDAAGHVQEGDPGTYQKPDGTLCEIDAPDGWQGIVVKYARNMIYGALFRDMGALPMQFSGHASKILKDQMWKYGTEAVVYFGILRMDIYNLPYSYDSWYMTEINMYKFDQQDDYVITEALEGELVKFLKSRVDTKYRISLDHINAFYVLRDGLTLTESARYEMVAGVDFAYNTYGTPVEMPLSFISKEGATSGIAWFTQVGQNVSSGFPITSQNFLAKAGANEGSIDVKIEGKLVYTTLNDGDGSTSFRMRFMKSSQDAGNQNDYALGAGNNISDGNGGALVTTDVDITIPMEPGEALFLRGIFFGSGPFDNANIQFTSDSVLKFTYNNKARKSYSKELYPIDLLKAIVGQMTDGLYTAESIWLSTKKDISYTSGTSIRRNGAMGDFIEISLMDLYKDLKRYGICLGIKNNKIVIERFADFFKSNEIIQLPEVSGLSISVAEELFFSKIRTGYRDIEYENVNGIYEFNNGSNWQAPHLKNDQELDLESPFRADPIGTELYRVEHIGKETTDSNSDKDVFVSAIETVSQTITQVVDFVNAGVYMTNPGNYPFNNNAKIQISGTALNNTVQIVVASGVNIIQFDPAGQLIVDEAGVNATFTFLTSGIFKFSRPAYSNINGIPQPMEADIYNTEITPLDTLINNGSLIHSVCDYMEDKSIKFLKTDKEKAAEFETVLAGVSKKQGRDIQIGSLLPKIILPYKLKFKTEVDINLLEIIDNDPYGLVSGYWKGYKFYGFLFDGGLEPHTKQAQEWILLASVLTDMRKFKTNE